MKSVVADWQTIVYCLRIVATNGTTIRLAQYPHDLTMDDGSIYKSDYGYEFTGFSATNNGAPPVIDVESVLDAAGISKVGLATKVWDNARCFLFATSWTNPVVDEEPIGKFLFGKVRIMDNRYKAEFMHIIDALNQTTGRNITPLCNWTVFDEHIDGTVVPSRRSKCTLTMTDFRVDGTVTSVTDNRIFTDSSRAEADDYFGRGEVLWLTGNNAGLPFQIVKSFSGGQFTLFQPAYYDIQVGDTYRSIPGCRLRFTEDCITKYYNGPNFGGYPSVVPPSVVSEIGNK